MPGIANLVIGGIGNPRFLLCGPELWPNRSFEVNTTGVTGAISRDADPTTPFGDYALSILDISAVDLHYGEFSFAAGETIAGKTFIILAYVKSHITSEVLFTTDFPDLAGNWTVKMVADGNWRQLIVREVTVPVGTVGSTLKMRVYPYDSALGVAAQGGLRVDYVRCRKVLDSFELPEPNRNEREEFFEEIVQAENELLDRSLKNYVLGHRYFYRANYPRLAIADELLRRKLMTRTKDILFFPHGDAPQTCYFVKFDDSYSYKWAHGIAAAGNAGNVSLKGLELLPEEASPIEEISLDAVLTEDGKYTLTEDGKILEEG